MKLSQDQLQIIQEQNASLNPEQHEGANTLYGPVLLLAGAGAGKALKNGSMVQTPNGPIEIQELKEGDSVFNSYGSVSTVTGVYPQGKKEVWEVEFSDGQIIECCSEHLWNYQTASQRSKKKPYKTATLAEIAQLPLQVAAGEYPRWNIYTPMTKAVQYPEQQYEIDPYLVGALIGDGSLTNGSIKFSNGERDVVLKVEGLLNEIGYELSQINQYDYSAKMINRVKPSPLRIHLQNIGLWGKHSYEKFIPENYLRGSVDQRLELLKGLIDTDGELAYRKSYYEYTTTSTLLRDDIIELVRSLGMTATYQERHPSYSYKDEIKEGRVAYRITIKASEDIPKIHSSQKHESNWTKGQSSARRTIRRIENTGVEAEMTCISVDSKDELFLTDGFVVTHNTKSMTVRIANLIAAGHSPYDILAMTFTRKAANEMNERLDAMLGESATKGIWMGTFHSTCVKILRKHGGLLGFDVNEKGYCNFTIYDPNDSFEVVKNIFVQLKYKDKHKEGYALHYMDDCKNKLWDPEHASYHKAETEMDQDMSIVYREYQSVLKRQNAMDFGDLIMNTVALLRDHPEARDYWQQKFKFVLCDEYQDTNYAQLQLLLLLAAPDFNFFCVGDFRQSIYGFRGSDISIILSFQQMFPSGKVVYLLKNYRSTKTIVDVGNRLIENNVNELNRDLESHNPNEHKIKYVHLQNEFQEAAYIIAQINKLRVLDPDCDFSDFAVLYRTNSQSRVIEDVCRNQFIPTKVIGGLSFYQREEIKDIVAYLRVILNEKDDVALSRILNKPARGIGKTTEQKVMDFAAEKNVSIARSLRAIDSIGLNKRASVKIEGFIALIEHFKKKMPEFKTSQKFVAYILEQSGLMNYYMSNKEAEDKVENLQEFMRLVSQYEEQFPDKTIEDFIQDVTLSTDTGKEGKGDNAVQLMTIHRSKGLEFKYVFSIGWSEGLFPSSQSRSEADIEEERRVAYVAITRAEKDLFITHADTRKQVDGKPKSYQPSRFLAELPAELIEPHQIKLN